MPLWLKRSLQIIAVLIVLIMLIYTALAFYVNANKKTLLVSVTRELNKNLNGSVMVGSMEPALLSGFPGVSVALKKVEIRDSLWKLHHHALLEARQLEVAVNAMALFKGTIEIRKVKISDAEIYLYTDSNGYSNTSILKSKPNTPPRSREERTSPAEIRKFELNKVRFVLDNRKSNKLFLFAIQEFSGRADYPSSGWTASAHLNTLVQSLAFNTTKGSFAKDKSIEGQLEIVYTKTDGMIVVKPHAMNIGADRFVVGAKFNTAKAPVDFGITIEARSILWKNASALLTPNISAKLNRFNLEKPIAVKAIISGNMGGGGDPSIFVNASVKGNRLHAPGGAVDQCSFAGVYTNNFINGRGFSDANSAVKLFRFSGAYQDIPFTVDTVAIHNFDQPVATGTFRSSFPVAKLNAILGTDILKFSRGSADLTLHYAADVVNFKLNKPNISGTVKFKNADMSYVPRNINFKNTSITLDFQKDDLFIKDIRLQSGKSIVFMEGSISNFLNLYYSNPEKIQLHWNMRSPQIYLGEFLGFIGSRKGAPASSSRGKSTGFARQINKMLDKGKADIHLRVDKVYYGNFLGTAANADILLSEAGITMNNVSLKHAGGTVRLKAALTQIGELNRFALTTVVSNVDIRQFFYAFDNFGLQTPTYKNLRGKFSTRTTVTGNVTAAGQVIPGSMNGKIAFNIQNGELVSYDAIKNVGKFAFPFRDLDHITFKHLAGNFDIRGEKIRINPMMISSSLLNMNLGGTYSMGKGTDLVLDVPLRNPKKDEDITDQREIMDRRMKGIVLHIRATDGDDGKIRFKLIGKQK